MEQLEDEELEALSCAIGRRPADAPTIAEVADLVQAVEREEDTLVVHFDQAAAIAVAAFAEAERQCCSAIDWRLETDATVRLRIGASPRQIDLLEQLFSAT